MFSTLPKTSFYFSVTFILSANAFNFNQSKILTFGKELRFITSNALGKRIYCILAIIASNAFRNYGSIKNPISQTSNPDVKCCLNPLPDMPILGFSNSAANEDMMSKVWTNWDTVI